LAISADFASRVVTYGNLLVVASGVDGTVEVFDRSNPIHPQRVATIDLGAALDLDGGSNLAVDGGFLYATAATRALHFAGRRAGSSLLVLDIRDVARLGPIHAFDPGRGAHDVDVHAGRAALALGEDGIALLDVSNPAAPRVLRRIALSIAAYAVAIDTGARRIWAAGETGAVALAEWDDSGGLREVAALPPPRFATSPLTPEARLRPATRLSLLAVPEGVLVGHDWLGFYAVGRRPSLGYQVMLPAAANGPR
jgi:hypothetical protein